MKTIKVEDAVGLALAHDITEIRPGEFKGPAFRKGHRVGAGDVCRLMRLGKRHLYVHEDEAGKIHEDEAVVELARALSGPGIRIEERPSEGKLQLYAAHDGLAVINVEALIAFNMIPDVMCASIHTFTPVKKDGKIAGTRAVPLSIRRDVLDRAVALAVDAAPVIAVLPFKPLRVRLAVTGSEVYDGLIEDRFEAVVRRKLTAYGATLLETVILPDDRAVIAQTLNGFEEKGTDLIITTGGMSVDPDDVTRLGIRDMGVHREYYGAGVLPGTMFLLAYRGELPVMGIPACALYHERTVFDLMLPRLLAGVHPDNRDLAALSHGGLCLDCPVCHFPACPFGKAGR
ncbi:molybdopterin-binding protein [Desulfatiferula olefinivorans]